VTAGLLHLMNHAATKALLFFVTGEIVQRYGNRRISAIRGALRAAPLAGWALLIGILAITGAPPFGIFVSELALIGAGFGGDWPAIAAVSAVVLLLGAIFAGLLMHTLRIAYGTPPPLQTSAHDGHTPVRLDWRGQTTMLIALAPLAIVMVWFGVHVPAGVERLLDDVAVGLGPVGR
jgi:hydrogenase-4 component F